MKYIFTILSCCLILLCISNSALGQTSPKMDNNSKDKTDKLAQATLGAGCFWCTEAVFEELKGVKKVMAGYAGGNVKNPSYSLVSTGLTGHVEVARIIFDPSVISYKQLLTVFWHVHDPTTLNRQGADVGTQYRSVIFYHNKKQRKIAEKSKKEVGKSGLWDDPIVTEIEPLENFSKAENYHQNYYKNNPNAGYCQVVIAPKLKKLRKEFGYLLKDK